jgi:fructose-1,6-bisphosphatase/inositol monophosphatase family enzyme
MPQSMTAFALSELLRVGQILAAAAREEIMPRFRKLHAAQIRQKSSAIDIVTEADEAAEAAIGAALESAFPGAVVVGEESCERDPALLDAIGAAELAFIVDPLDGTRNFASHLPLFGVMAAITMRGEVVAGVIHDPVCQDWICALRGGGAWTEQPDGARAPLRVAAPAPVAEMDGVVGTRFIPEPLRSSVIRNLARLRTFTWLSCAAHEYRLAASGKCHILLYNRLMPWDHAAGWLIHREAGGYSAHFDGSAYSPTHRSGGLLCAPDEASWHAGRAALLEP